MSLVHRRPKLAAEMARQLLEPGVLTESLRSGLFLSGLRRTGKTTFLVTDLIPALEDRGAIVIYVDLWSDVQANPSDLVLRAIRRVLEDLRNPASAVVRKLFELTKAEAGGFGLKFTFALDKLGVEGGATLAQALTEVVDQAKTDVVLIVDEVQHALGTEDGQRLMLALKAARDAINARPRTPGHFLFIGTGSHRALVHELTTRRNQAFAGATSVAYPVLDREYVEHVVGRLAQEASGPLPSVDAAVAAFGALGHRPEELLRALRLLRAQLPPGGDPDEHLATIAATLRATAADGELFRLEQLGGLATAIFERIAAAPDGTAKGLFAADAAADYSRALGRDVRVEEIQPAVNELMAANLIMRVSHGTYAITDPFVHESWRATRRLTAKP